MRHAWTMAAAGLLAGIGLIAATSVTRAPMGADPGSVQETAPPRRPAGRRSPSALPPRNLRLSPDPYFNGEPSIAADPRNPGRLVAAWMHSGAPRTVEIQVTSSVDGGATWREPVTFDHVDPAYGVSADVSVAFDGAGRVHLTYMDMEADPAADPGQGEFLIRRGEVVHRRSDDGGATWSAPVRVRHSAETPDFAIDRPWIAVDRSGGPRDGWLYVVTISFFGDPDHDPPQHVHLKRSTDHGATWSEDVRVDGGGYGTGPLAGVPFPAVADVGGDGTLWIVYPSVGSEACPETACLLAAVSTDGGRTFTRSKVADVSPASRRGYPLFQAIAADRVRAGHCVVVWPDGRLDPEGSDLLLARSVDGGATWSSPLRVNDNPVGLGVGVDQPWAAAGPEGSLAVAWRDRRAAGPGPEAAFEIYAAVSPDGGGHFLPNRKISDHPSPYDPLPCCNSFLGLAVAGERLHAVWGDFREGRWDVFFARSPLDGDH